MKIFIDSFFSLHYAAKEAYIKRTRGNFVTFEGQVVETWNKKIVLYAGNDYKGESWSDITSLENRKRMLPYTFIGQSDFSLVHFPKGTWLKIKGRLDAFGDYHFGTHWKLKDIEFLEAGEVE